MHVKVAEMGFKNQRSFINEHQKEFMYNFSVAPKKVIIFFIFIKNYACTSTANVGESEWAEVPHRTANSGNEGPIISCNQFW